MGTASEVVERIPDYLKQPTKPLHYYGQLQYDKQDKSWIITGEPSVVEMAKRLFPGCSGRGRGIARFKANKRTNGDLNWLMLRFPLEIVDGEVWKETWEETVTHVVRREQLNNAPKRVKPISLKVELRPFQEEGLAFLLHNRRTLLADEMGLGKTAQVLAFLAHTNEYPSLFVCQAHNIKTITDEIVKFIDIPLMKEESNVEQTTLFEIEEEPEELIHVIRGRKNYELPRAGVYIIHYGLLASWKDTLPYFGFRSLLFDEVQELRNTGTQKYSAASLIADETENVIGLSGTPIHNRGGEIFNVINILDRGALGDWAGFTREWCRGYGTDVVQDPVLLGDYLRREGLLLRRRKEDVLDDLPPKRRVVQAIDSDKGVFDDLIQSAVEKATSIDGIKDQLQRGRLTREIVNETRQSTGIAKAPYVVQFVKMLLEAGETVLLFAYHHSVFDIYMKELKQYDPVKITGRETAKQKEESIRRFMSGETNLSLISLRASAGLNLQRGRVVVFGELEWSPAVHSQAEDRVHRIGQKDSVLAYYLVSETGSDEDMQEALGLKVSQFTGLMGDKAETEEDKMLGTVATTEHMNKIVDKLKIRGVKQVV